LSLLILSEEPVQQERERERERERSVSSEDGKRLEGSPPTAVELLLDPGGGTKGVTSSPLLFLLGG
jgi:hypothetical protein